MIVSYGIKVARHRHNIPSLSQANMKNINGFSYSCYGWSSLISMLAKERASDRESEREMCANNVSLIVSAMSIVSVVNAHRNKRFQGTKERKTARTYALRLNEWLRWLLSRKMLHSFVDYISSPGWEVKEGLGVRPHARALVHTMWLWVRCMF